MRHKLIFIAAVICLFIVSGVLGFCLDGSCVDAWKKREISANYVPPGVPKRVAEKFGRHFSQFDISEKPMFLPDHPFKDMAGKDVRIRDFAGKPTLVNLWATWCMSCVVELPSMKKMAEYYDGRLNVVAISVEEGRPEKEIADFLEKRELGDFAGYVDQSGDFARSLGIRGIPTSFLIGSDGLILYRFEGDADWTGQDSKDFFDVFLMQNR